MPCGHPITPESLIAYCRSSINDGKFQIICPHIDGKCQAPLPILRLFVNLVRFAWKYKDPHLTHPLDTNNVYCRTEWQYVDIRKRGALNDEECLYFESKLSDNYALHVLGIQECPKIW